MTLWLLNTFSTWQLGLIVMAVFVGLAALGLWLVYRVFPGVRASTDNDVAGVMLGLLAAVYGIVLAFVIVELYQEYKDAASDARAEATALAQVYRGTTGLPRAARVQVRAEIRDYVRDAVDEEYAALRDGRHSDAAQPHIAHMFEAVAAVDPQDDRVATFQGETVGRLNELVAARRARIRDADETLPGTLKTLLYGGAVMLVVFTLPFGMPSSRMHAALVLSVAALIGFNIFLALALDHPFSGEVSVSTDVYREGVLGDL